MRVLHVVKGLGPGGAERLLLSLAQVRGAAVDFHVGYLLPWKEHLVEDLHRAGVGTTLLGDRRGMRDPRWPWRLRRLVASGSFDVVHLHSPAVASVARPIVRSLGRSRPALVSTEHNLWTSFALPTRVANALTLPLDDARLAVGDEVRASAWRPWQARTEVLTHGIPLDTLRRRRGERSGARAELGLDDDAVAVVTVANLRENKDYPTLLRAARSACDADDRLRFFAVGQGPLEADLHDRHRELALGERFSFLGFRPDAPRVLAAADIFTLTSRYEGLPIALLEAFALGVPAVASRIGAIPRVLRDGLDGVLVEPGDPGAFADHYVALARDHVQRRSMAASATSRAEDFDIARTWPRLAGIYQRAAWRHGAKDPLAATEGDR